MGHQQERHTWNAPRKHLSTRRTRCRANLEDHTLQVSNRLACCSLACLNSCNNIPATSEDQGNKDTHKVTRHCGEHEQLHRRDPALSKHRGTKSVGYTRLQSKGDRETGTCSAREMGKQEQVGTSQIHECQRERTGRKNPEIHALRPGTNCNYTTGLISSRRVA